MARSAYRASASEPLLFYLGAGSGWIFYVFDEAGVLYASGNPSIGTAAWDLAGEGERFAGIRVPRREDFLLGSILGVALLVSSKPPAPGADLADLLKKNPQDYDLALGHFLDLTPEALGMFRPQLIASVGSLLLGAGLNLWLRYQRKPEYGNMVLAGMMVALLACVHAAFVTFSPILSSKQLAAVIARHYQPGDVIVIYGQYHEASTLNFYLKTRVRVLHEPSGNLWYGSKFPDAPRVFETQASFEELWTSPSTVFLWTDQDHPKELVGLTQHFLVRRGGKSIFTNREVGR